MRTPSSQKCRLDLAPPWADRFISGITPSITARYFSAGPSDSILRYSLDGHPALRSTASGGFRSVLACVQLSPSCPFRRLHTFRFLRPARLRTPLLGYGAPHLSARGTSTLLNNALLSAHFRLADNPPESTPQKGHSPKTSSIGFCLPRISEAAVWAGVKCPCGISCASAKKK